MDGEPCGKAALEQFVRRDRVFEIGDRLRERGSSGAERERLMSGRGRCGQAESAGQSAPNTSRKWAWTAVIFSPITTFAPVLLRR